MKQVVQHQLKLNKMHGNGSGSQRTQSTYPYSKESQKVKPYSLKQYGMSSRQKHLQRTNSNYLSKETQIQSGFSKKNFLNSRCQILLKENIPLPLLKSQDPEINWEDISYLRFHTFADSQCPICLSLPVAPVVTQCGHLYCWHCALQYISYENKKNSKKCVLCEKWISYNELKRAELIIHEKYFLGSEIKFRLMKKERKSWLVTPMETSADCNEDNYIKYQCSTKQKEIMLISQHLNQLDIEIEDSQNMGLLDESLACLLEVKRMHTEELVNLQMEKEVYNTVNPMTIMDTNGVHYFYQADTGQNIFLYSLNWRMLNEECRNKNKPLPTSFVAKIVELGSDSVTEEFRARHRYLNHLPLLSEVKFAEVEFGADMISDETIAKFEKDIKVRSDFKKRDKKRERLLTEKKLREENNLIGATNLSLTGSAMKEIIKSEVGVHQAISMPIFGDGDFVPLESKSGISDVDLCTTMMSDLSTSKSSLSYAQSIMVPRMSTDKRTLENKAKEPCELSESSVEEFELRPPSTIDLMSYVITSTKKTRRKKK